MPPPLRELERIQSEFGGQAAEGKLAQLRMLDRMRLGSARAVHRHHEVLCFLRASPDDERVLSEVERQLAGFDQRAGLRRFAIDLQDSGIAGTELFDQVEQAGYPLPTDWSAYEPYQSEINLSEVPEDKILRLRKQAYRRFYVSPRRLWRIFKLIPNKSNMLPFLTLLFARRAYAR
jgi:hypothetical protein